MRLRPKIKDKPTGDGISSQIISQWVAMGLCFGVTVGALTDNVGLGISLGMCFGAAIGSVISEYRKREKSEGS
ncbi:hypothetical protein [Pseudohongiella sp. O18]|uniref:hypothetical protein n=1 Tax=Pseudohongiella sp. O18 TaxID=2904248 RepID=UPI001F41B04B|nr:hypothetical protein [Pseudohongiella sp. O18]